MKTSDLAAPLADAYEQSLLYGEHTFGPWGLKSGAWETGIRAHNIYGDEWKDAYDRGVFNKIEQAGFGPMRAYAQMEVEIVNREWASRLKLLAKSVNGSGSRMVVYNGLPWPRREMSKSRSTRQIIFVENVPASGYKTVSLPDSPIAATPSSRQSDTLETPFYKVAFDLQPAASHHWWTRKPAGSWSISLPAMRWVNTFTNDSIISTWRITTRPTPATVRKNCVCERRPACGCDVCSNDAAVVGHRYSKHECGRRRDTDCH